jgi:hypothetical protein
LICYITSCLFASHSHPRFQVRFAYSVFLLWLILLVHDVESEAFLEPAELQIASDFSIIRVGTSTSASLGVLVDRLGLDDSLLLDRRLIVILAVITVDSNLALLGGLALGTLSLGGSLLSGSLGGRGVGRCHGAVGGRGGIVELEELLSGDAQHLTSRVGGLGTGELRELLVVDL